MIEKTYLSKCCSIIKDSDLNTGINPVGEIIYGHRITRMLVYFDLEKLCCKINDKVYPDISKFKHTLKMTNCGSIDFSNLHSRLFSEIDDTIKVRTSSFDLIFFLIPKEWDSGKGFDYSLSYFNQGYYRPNCGYEYSDARKLISTDGANWYNAKTKDAWNEEGVYSNTTLSKEYDKFSEGQPSIVIGRQHFDIGNEDIEFDVTDVVTKFLNGTLKNYGIGIAYSPMLEISESKVENYVGFFTQHTNTFFEPYLESVYDECVEDDRANFILGKNNRLYLYANINGNLTNLDEIPTCYVNDTQYEVKQATKGIYYIDINISAHDYKPNTMLYDIWGNIKYDGVEYDDVELEFVTKSNTSWLNIGSVVERTETFIPTAFGIKENEDIVRKGELRKVNVLARVPYTNQKAQLIDEMYYRLYVMDGNREITVIPFTKINRSVTENYFMLDCEQLIPQKYFLDIRIKYNGEIRNYKNILSFNIVSQLGNLYN